MFLIPLCVFILPTIFLFREGFSHRKSKPDKAKVWYILAALYLIIGFGICGSIIG
ncbi:hypothetical protein ACFO3U_07360 [Flavobacterium ponti]|uniref:Cardiolipin synthase N-terminal domain-containing protein n=1 Tax=Flavobacterium ponti TaxID=665133 RepID=A0ABV9P2L1_9FLAO